MIYFLCFCAFREKACAFFKNHEQISPRRWQKLTFYVIKDTGSSIRVLKVIINNEKCQMNPGSITGGIVLWLPLKPSLVPPGGGSCLTNGASSQTPIVIILILCTWDWGKGLCSRSCPLAWGGMSMENKMVA